MRKLGILFALLILSISFSNAELEEPKLVKQTSINFKESGRIMVLNGEWFGLALNLSVPQNRSYQTAFFTGEKIIDSEGNTLLRKKVSNPENPYEYNFTATIKTNERRTTQLPKNYAITDELLSYIEPTEKAQAEHPEIKTKALEITEGASTDFEKISLLAIWVSENIDYDINSIGKNKDAVQVLQEKKGVCLEHSNLFTALARSLGYPTRYVLGKAYGSYGWLGHSWNEVYLGKWVPVDPTWLEVGRMDATHIEFHRSATEVLLNEVKANATSGSRIEWPNDNSFFGVSDNESGVFLQSSQTNTPNNNYIIKTPSNAMGFNDESIVYLSFESNDYDVLRTTLVSCSHESWIIEVEEPTKYVITKPGKNITIAWKIKSNPDLDKNMIYTCPLTLNSKKLAEKSVSVKVRANKENPELKMTVEKPLVSVGSEQKINVFVYGNATKAFLLYNDSIMQEEIIGTEAVFSFKPKKTGVSKVIAFTDQGGVTNDSFTVKKSTDISIKEIKVPRTVMEKQEFSVNVTLENNKNEEKKLTLKAIFLNETRTENFELEKEATISFKFTPLKKGKSLLKIKLNEDDEANVPIDVKEASEVKINSVDFIRRNGQLLTQVAFTKTSTVKELKATVGGQDMASDNIDLSPGEHTLVFTWKDPVGNSYSKEKKIVVPEMPGQKKVEGIELDENTWALIAVLVACSAFGLVVMAIAVALHSRGPAK